MELAAQNRLEREKIKISPRLDNGGAAKIDDVRLGDGCMHGALFSAGSCSMVYGEFWGKGRGSKAAWVGTALDREKRMERE